ncbi:MAG TPA: hypothetical protein VFH04_00230 [Nitrososphaeraceae archaeon]|nr:hypothetical protein [Nitrososphaeraceae archaeon]
MSVNADQNAGHIDSLGDLRSLFRRLSSHVSSISSLYTMSQAEYRKLQKKSDGETLLVTIPIAFAQSIPLLKSYVVKMTLEGKRITIEKA